MRIQTIVGAALIFTACGNSQNQQQKSEETHQGTSESKPIENPPLSGTHCFLKTEGDRNQDSTKVQLTIMDNTVTGTMAWLPAEKDARKGTLKGIITDGVVKADWTYMQEGMENTLAVEFKLEADKLSQKKSKFDQASGEETLDEKSGYDIIYQAATCK